MKTLKKKNKSKLFLRKITSLRKQCKIIERDLKLLEAKGDLAMTKMMKEMIVWQLKSKRNRLDKKNSLKKGSKDKRK